MLVKLKSGKHIEPREIVRITQNGENYLIEMFNIEKNVEAGTSVMTDEWHAYNKLNEKYKHSRCNHGAKKYVDAAAHTNGIENFWSHLKRGVEGIYHWVSRAHLQRYVDEFALRYNTRKEKTDARFNLVLGNITGRLKFQTLIGK